ncbi:MULTISPECIES: ABC transporter permease [Rhizobium]|uniref:ABC transporter permease n=1 Tax=Rhizobium TaxID=379 RepID=UPI00195A9C58|nr:MULTISPECIES: ABC transporter permease [Rhizobium]MBM7043967.1 ABC transporter permease [Rhizobium lusitanum]
MKTYIIGRIAQALLVLWGAYTVTYAILYLLPSDALTIMLTASGIDIDTLSADQIAQARHHYGLDRGVVEQYFHLLGNLLHGDLGTSLATGNSVAALLAERLPQTLMLSGLAVTLSILGGFSLAYVAGWLRWRPLKAALRRLPALGLSVPVFWTGLILIQIFSFTLGWLPAMGNKGFASLILPAVTLAIPSAAIYAQVLMRGFDDVWAEPFIATAQAKGLSRGQIQRRHVLRNAALPILTLIGLQVGNTVSGAVLVETVFTRIGVGRLAQEAVLRQDIPVVLAIVTVSAAAFVIVNLIVDLLYPLLDPRIARVGKAV